MKFLICDDGLPPAAEAVRLGSALARGAGAETVRLRVVPPRGRVAPQPPAPGERVRVGDPVEQILAEAASGKFDLIAIGSRGGRGLAKLIMGSTSSRLAKHSPVPLLIVKGRRESLQRILVCTGGEQPGENDARWGGQVARWTEASVAILHVMSQLPLAESAPLADLRDTAEEAIAQGTREGRHLQRAMELARQSGASGKVEARLRHGLVLDEILAEVEAGDYDLVVIGGHVAPGGDLLRGLLLDDVTDQIIEQCPRPVLVVRSPA